MISQNQAIVWGNQVEEAMEYEDTVVDTIEEELERVYKHSQVPKKSLGVQVDNSEVEALRAQVDTLRFENMTLKKELQKRNNSSNSLPTCECHATKLKPKDKAENKYKWMNESDKKFKCFTGLSQKEFTVLYEFLNPEEANLTFWKESKNTGKPTLSLKCQLAITLWRLRQGSTLLELSYHFEISLYLLRRITLTWIQFMYKQFDSIQDAMYVTRNMHKPVPSHFRNAILRDVRIVIDCTEILCETSTDYAQVGNMYSQYKSHSSSKVLIGVAPCGACMFVSDCYEGSISDRRITVESGLLEKIVQGDVILGDRGFTIHDLCAEKGATLEISPFFGRKTSI